MSGLFDTSFDESTDEVALATPETVGEITDEEGEVLAQLTSLEDPENQLLLQFGTEEITVSRAEFEGKTVADLFEQYAPFLGIEFDPSRINYRSDTDFISPDTPTVAGKTYSSSIAHDGKGN